MCGRARLSSDVSEIKVAFGIPPSRSTPNFAASWNVAPTDPLPVVRFDATDHQRSLDVMRWGLIPYWAKDIKIGFSTFNARAEDEAWPQWLGEEPAGVPQLKSLLAPYPSDEMICWPVSARVGNVRNNDPSLIEPIAAAG
jgi:putative SOS response-associated peptidase YedK